MIILLDTKTTQTMTIRQNLNFTRILISNNCDKDSKIIERMIPLKQRVLEYIFYRKHVSLAELKIYFEDEFTGDNAWYFTPYTNLIIWSGINQAFTTILNDLQVDKLIQVKRCMVLIYAIDGVIPNMKVARYIRQYKKPRWLPVVFNPTSKCYDILGL